MKGDGSEAPGVRPAGDDIEGLSYERALAELDQIIERLERGAVALDEGARLAQHCGSLLDRTEQKVTQLVVGAGGRIAERPLEPEREVVELPAVPPGAPLTPLPGRRDVLDIDPDEIPF